MTTNLICTLTPFLGCLEALLSCPRLTISLPVPVNMEIYSPIDFFCSQWRCSVFSRPKQFEAFAWLCHLHPSIHPSSFSYRSSRLQLLSQTPPIRASTWVHMCVHVQAHMCTHTNPPPSPADAFPWCLVCLLCDSGPSHCGAPIASTSHCIHPPHSLTQFFDLTRLIYFPPLLELKITLLLYAKWWFESLNIKNPSSRIFLKNNLYNWKTMTTKDMCYFYILSNTKLKVTTWLQ